MYSQSSRNRSRRLNSINFNRNHQHREMFSDLYRSQNAPMKRAYLSELFKSYELQIFIKQQLIFLDVQNSLRLINPWTMRMKIGIFLRL